METNLWPYRVLTCDGYVMESSWATLSEALGACRESERASADGFARVITLDGQIIADSDGLRSDPDRYVDAATQTGMYDAW